MRLVAIILTITAAATLPEQIVNNRLKQLWCK